MRQFCGALFFMVAAAALLAAGNTSTVARAASEETKTQAVPEAPQDRAPGETLSDQLNRTNGVVHPPATADHGSVKPVPPVGSRNMPVIPPPGSGNGDQKVQPK